MKNSAIWIYAVGIFMFIWGFCQMGYAFMGFDLPITIPYTEWGTLLGEEELFSNMQLGLAISCMLTGIGLLIFRAWARVFTIWIIWTFAGFFFYIFLLIGPLEFEEFFAQKFALFFGAALLLLWLFNQEDARETLNSDPQKKQNRLIPFFTMLLISIGIFVFVQLPVQLPLIFTEARFPEIQEVNYSSPGEKHYKSNYNRTEFPLSYTVAIPKGSVLMSLNQASGFHKEGQCEIRLDTPGQAQTIFLSRETPLQLEWSSESTQKFLERILLLSPYHYARKKFSDRRSIIYWKSRNEIGQWGGDAIHEVNMGGMKNFVVEVEKYGNAFGKDIRWYFDFNLYLKDESAGGGKIIAFKGNKKASTNILASLEPQLTQPKTAFDFHQEGKERVKKKRYEKAKMSFASALCLEEENPDYHYSMGEAFYKTANYEQADRHLTKTMELKNESLEAKKLFEKTRKKLGKSNELESGEKPESP
jgi:tetratricopeptide (TPR) repeat protein